MSLQLINQYYTQLDKIKRYSGADNERIITGEFGKLINHYGEKRNLLLIPELPVKTKDNKTIRPDGTLKNSLRLDFGYWESKANVDFAKEIDNKIRTGYPLSNTLFEDGKIAILYQHGAEAIRCKIDEPERLDKLLTAFVSLEPQAVKDFTKAVEAFKKPCEIFYYSLKDEQTKKEKLEIISQSHLDKIPFDTIRPDKNNNWINLADNDFETLLPLASKEVKENRNKDTDHAIFKLFSLGVVTARDEWVYDYDEKYLEKKVKFLISNYNQDVVKHSGKTKDEIRNLVDYSIKWTRAVKNDLSKGRSYEYNKTLVLDSLYRPFVKKKIIFQ